MMFWKQVSWGVVICICEKGVYKLQPLVFSEINYRFNHFPHVEEWIIYNLGMTLTCVCVGQKDTNIVRILGVLMEFCREGSSLTRKRQRQSPFHMLKICNLYMKLNCVCVGQGHLVTRKRQRRRQRQSPFHLLKICNLGMTLSRVWMRCWAS